MAPSKNSPLCRVCWHPRSKHDRLIRPAKNRKALYGRCQRVICVCKGYQGVLPEARSVR